ncbi:hypothetical protein [Labrys monachus]|uniref:Uncharacterized protein n=1 Tax=Labrys monachus TaxID=217067 RepID=A0ABU0FAY5_9HYPH|nr:hypothetical protein [Labrys monachus]MDQ0391777.1 hypothetical protein [Labrys monachus]
MKNIRTQACAVLLGATALAFVAMGASARIVCNEEGDCWHVQSDYEYRPEFRLTVHPDDWQWQDEHKYRWREHQGRGYWRGGEWSDF